MEQGEFDLMSPVSDIKPPLDDYWEALEDRATTIWNIPFRKKVRFRLKHLRDEFEGTIRLASRPTVWERHAPLCLRMKKMTFTSHEMESSSLID